MLKQEIGWFFVIFNNEFHLITEEAFQIFMLLALAHFFGFYNPKQLADFLNIRSQRFYNDLKKNQLLQPENNASEIHGHAGCGISETGSVQK